MEVDTFCAQHAVAVPWHACAKMLTFVVTWLARLKILDGPKHDFLPRNGTKGHEQPRSVPSGSRSNNTYGIAVSVLCHGIHILVVHAGQQIRHSPSLRCTFSRGEKLRSDPPEHPGDANLLFAKVMMECFFLVWVLFDSSRPINQNMIP